MQPVPPAHGPSDACVLQFPVPYEERYRWTPNTVAGAALGAASLLAAILVPALPLLVRVPLAVAGTAGAASCVACSTSGKVALRLDRKGVTLGGGPLRHQAHASFFPWEGIRAVVLWRRAALPRWLAPRWPVRYISVQRYTELPSMPPGGSGPAGQPAPRHRPEPRRPAPEDFKAGATRGMRAFRVDEARLAAAIAAFAPTVELIKLA
jgi:hypothetical protein